MSLNVLITDDSAVMRTMIAKAIGLAGLPVGEVFQAANGREGLAVLEKSWVDVVFLDINMPEMNGMEMLETMRQDPALAQLPVIVISTEGSTTRIEEVHQKGAKFIHKPFAPETVREIVQEITGVECGQAK